MFTGIVSDVGEVRAVTPRSGEPHRISISCSYPRDFHRARRFHRLLRHLSHRDGDPVEDVGRTLFSG